jgi:hypothetical protein
MNDLSFCLYSTIRFLVVSSSLTFLHIFHVGNTKSGSVKPGSIGFITVLHTYQSSRAEVGQLVLGGRNDPSIYETKGLPV